MQVEEKPSIFELEKMTCTDMDETVAAQMPSNQNAEPTGNTSNDDEFEGINLEDDIEKVEVSSHNSTDSSDDEEDLQHFEEFQRNYVSNEEEFRNWMLKIKEMQNTIYKKIQAGKVQQQPNNSKVVQNSTPTTTPNRVMQYEDLPYMGEITLDNSKPRRGRKPKKADICHLIYKNYGTILPGTPNPSNYLQENSSSSKKSSSIPSTPSSLLEKRLTQQDHKKLKSAPGKSRKNHNEPMNLCVRDLHPLKLKLTKNSDDTYSTQIKSEPQSDTESDLINLNDEYGVPQFLMNNNSSNSQTRDNPAFWNNQNTSNPNLLLQQQLNMYYEKLAGISVHNPRPPPDIIPIEKKPKKIIKIKPKHQVEQSYKSNEKCSSKRKRSAIFIPPISTESNASPATEVSICKFKFTGGAKPSLQEKKMLSVDSGGNFRYYSGTGDKSMRGYEFFPRETLQQTASATQGSSTGAFLQASGEKFYPVNEFDEKQVKSEFLLSPDLPSTSSSINASPYPEISRHKKRKSRKSLQREKLEQTFKEKGFLIQTQQLESAEGATYCKFRQLRKFTRYLFRSWKDYLPGNVQDAPENSRMSVDIPNLETT